MDLDWKVFHCHVAYQGLINDTKFWFQKAQSGQFSTEIAKFCDFSGPLMHTWTIWMCLTLEETLIPKMLPLRWWTCSSTIGFWMILEPLDFGCPCFHVFPCVWLFSDGLPHILKQIATYPNGRPLRLILVRKSMPMSLVRVEGGVKHQKGLSENTL